MCVREREREREREVSLGSRQYQLLWCGGGYREEWLSGS